MIDFFGYKPTRGYFAAYNGYKGFTSLFDNTFNPLCHDRVFILKGGPGTGKSTIMKGIIKWANGKDIFSEAIYCSSDPMSLDGVILRKGDKSVAILDGTAPHTYDPKFPGVKDEIINLGEGFNNTKLSSYADKVCDLGSKKAEAYANAYSYLGLAGEIKKILNQKHGKLISSERLSMILDELTEKIKCEESVDKYEIFCISSFGRFGYSRIDEVYSQDKTVIEIKGDGYTEYTVMRGLADYAIKEKKAEAICPEPLGADAIEALFTENYVFIIGSKGEKNVETAEISESLLENERLTRLYDEIIELAKEEFVKASDYHFKIEEIYRMCMDFEVNDAFFVDIIEKINDLL